MTPRPNDVPPEPFPSGLEVTYQSQYSEVEPNRRAAVYPDQGPEFYDPKASNDVPTKPRVCGLMSRRMFWISVAAVVIITAAALGSGLGARRTNSPQITPTSSMGPPSIATFSPATSSTATSRTATSSMTTISIDFADDSATNS
jgi:hypothetical protein